MFHIRMMKYKKHLLECDTEMYAPYIWHLQQGREQKKVQHFLEGNQLITETGY